MTCQHQISASARPPGSPVADAAAMTRLSPETVITANLEAATRGLRFYGRNRPHLMPASLDRRTAARRPSGFDCEGYRRTRARNRSV